MNTFDAYISGWKKYATFRGRATRQEYWSFYLINIALLAVVMFIEEAVGLAPKNEEEAGILSMIAVLAMLLPIYAVTVRRYHDSGHRGWWIFMPIYSFILLFFRSQPGENKYGPSPMQTSPSK